MANFQSITVIVAIVILIICLIFIGIQLRKSKYDKQYPPVTGDCPDYWLDMSDGTGSNCINKQADLGNADCAKTMDFSGAFWTGDSGLCRKSQWAKRCNLTWDGVTNNSHACDTATPPDA